MPIIGLIVLLLVHLGKAWSGDKVEYYAWLEEEHMKLDIIRGEIMALRCLQRCTYRVDLELDKVENVLLCGLDTEEVAKQCARKSAVSTADRLFGSYLDVPELDFDLE